MNGVYQASSIKRRRATKAEMVERFDALFAIIERQRPMTVRQCFYQATVSGLVEKSEQGCARINTALTHMRRSGRIPYDWLTDSTRLMRKPRSHRGIKQALEFLPGLIERHSGRTPKPMSRSGSKRMPSPASCSM